MAANSYLTYDDYQPDMLKIPGNLPSWVFNRPFRTFEDVSTGIEQAYQAAQKTQQNEMLLEAAKQKQQAQEEARSALRDNPDLLRSKNVEDIDNALLGPMLKSGDIEEVAKIIERRDARNRQEEMKKAQMEAQKEKRAQDLEYRQSMLDLRQSALDLRKNAAGTKDGFKDKVVDMVSPDGQIIRGKVVKTADELGMLRSQGYRVLSDDLLDQTMELSQLGFKPEEIQMLKKKGIESVGPQSSPTPKSTPPPIPLPPMVEDAIGSYRARNGKPPLARIPLR